MLKWFPGFVFLSLLLMSSCNQQDWTKLQLKNLNGSEVALSEAANQQTIFIFLSPECPLCRSYSVKIRELMETHSSDSLQFIGVVSGNFYPKDDIQRFLRKYELDLPVLLDPEFKLAHTLNANITPEVFYTHSGEILYRGAIDDWAISLGQKKLKVHNDYLHSAILAHQQQKAIDPKQTKAIGCFIE